MMEESRRVYVSEEAPEPRELPQVCEQEMRSMSCQEDLAKLQSQVRAVELCLRELRAEKEHYKKLYLSAKGQIEQMQTCWQEQNTNLERRLEKLDLLKEKSDIVTSELPRLQGAIERHSKNTQNFKEALQDLEYNLEGSKQLNSTKEEITKECRDESTWETAPEKELLQVEIENLRAEVSKLRENEKIVKDMNSDLTVKLALFESEIVNKHEKNKHLTAQVHYLQLKVDSLKQTKEATVIELDLLHRVTERQNERIHNLKEAVQDFKSNLQDAQQQIRTKEEIIMKQNSEIVERQQTLEELSLYVTDMEQSAHDLKSRLATMQQEEILADINNFLEQIRNESTEPAIPEEYRGERTWETTPGKGHLLAEIENLLGEIYDLRESEKIQNEKNKSLSDELGLLKCQIEKKQEENICLRAEVYGLQENEKILKEKSTSLSDELVLLKSELENKQEKNRNLCAKLRKLQEQLDSLNEVSDSTAAELDQFHCLTKRKSKENWNLKETVQHLGYKLEEAQQLIRIKQELIIKKNNETAYREQTIEELYLHVTDMRQSIYDLRSQLELKHEEEILAGVHKSLEGFSTAENTNQVAIAMKCRDEDTVENTPEECRDNSVLETPAAQGQTERRWIKFSKKLLKAAVFGVTIVGAAFLATTLNATYSIEQNSCMYNCVTEILYPYCSTNQHGCYPY